jgi:hypothetical protein
LPETDDGGESELEREAGLERIWLLGLELYSEAASFRAETVEMGSTIPCAGGAMAKEASS